MGFTSDNVPQKSPLSREYRDFVAGIAKDVVSLMRYKPILDSMYMDVAGGAGGGESISFPAIIFGGDFYGPYTFKEVDPSNGEELSNGAAGEAYNTMELNLVGGGGQAFYPPGLTQECIDAATPPESPLTISALPIAPTTVVMMSKHFKTGLYFFCVPNAICAQCSQGNLAQIQLEEISTARASSFSTKVKSLIPSFMRGTGRSGGY